MNTGAVSFFRLERSGGDDYCGYWSRTHLETIDKRRWADTECVDGIIFLNNRTVCLLLDLRERLPSFVTEKSVTEIVEGVPQPDAECIAHRRRG